MSDKFDYVWEGKMLELLQTQCSGSKRIEGKVIFVCEDNDRIEVTTSVWCFSDADLKELVDSSYRYLCLPLLDNLIEYRSMYKGLKFRGGILTLQKAKSTVEWTSQSEAIRLIESEELY